VTAPYEPTPPPTVPPPQPSVPPGRAVAGPARSPEEGGHPDADGPATSGPGTDGHDAGGPDAGGPDVEAPATGGPDAGAPAAGGRGVAGPAAPPAEVPDLDDRDRELHPRIVTVWRFSTVVSLLPPVVVLSAIAVAFLGATGWLVPSVLLVLLGAFAAWYPGARYARWRWRFTDLAIELEHGVLVRQAEALPYFRIQQIDVNEGPIDRLLGLASLQVTSASATGSVSLPGIAAQDAPGLRRALLARAAAAVGERGTGVRDAV
jgi:uncharacterized protein